MLVSSSLFAALLLLVSLSIGLTILEANVLIAICLGVPDAMNRFKGVRDE